MTQEQLRMQMLAGIITEGQYKTKLNEDQNNKSIDIEGDIITVGDKIRWRNISLNQYRQGTITDITDDGIFVTQDSKNNTKLHIRPPYEDKSIFKIG
jgi:hypothetical protein